jgi:hypothetical protein
MSPRTQELHRQSPLRIDQTVIHWLTFSLKLVRGRRFSPKLQYQNIVNFAQFFRLISVHFTLFPIPSINGHLLKVNILLNYLIRNLRLS